MLQAVTHVANSLGHLKTKYLKYLETLCAANGIDIQQLKSSGSQYELLEIFFGGYPVLVGLKYFKSLRVLKIFGQNINSLKPLAEVAGTLEELWICEGQLKDFSGIEHCSHLKKLYLYENEAEDAPQLSSLTNLELLHLEDNSLQDLSFLEKLHNLVYLNLRANKLSERELSTVTLWSSKLQTLDLSENVFNSFKAIFTCCTCPSLRYIYVNSPGLALKNPENEENFMAWLAFHFRFLENLDGDNIQEIFITGSLLRAESLLAEKLNEIVGLEEGFTKEKRVIEKSAQKVEAKLIKLCNVLERLKETLPTKDAKREIVKRVLEVAHSNNGDVKSTKKKCMKILSFIYKLMRYNISLQLESSNTAELMPANEAELATLTHFLNYNCSMKHNYAIGIQHCVMIRPLRQSDMEKLCLIEKDEGLKIWTERELILLLDHHNRPDYRSGNIRVYRDVELLRKEAKEKTTTFFQPIFVNKPLRSVPSSLLVTPVQDEKAQKPMDRTPRDDIVYWKDLLLVAIAVVELQFPSHLHVNHLRYREVFDESFDEQLKKLKEMNINVEIKDDQNRRVSIVEPTSHEPSLENMVADKASKVLKIKDLITVKTLRNRCSISNGYETCLTVRNPVEVSLAYGSQPTFVDLVELQTRITLLDFESLKLTKIAGIEMFTNLQYLSLKDNKITSLKKLRLVRQLKFLDASYNRISKVEQLPETLVENVKRLNVTGNYIRTLKGIEACKNLSTLMVGLNQIKERSEVNYLLSLTKLWLLDLTGNPVASCESVKEKIIYSLPILLTLNRQPVSKDSRPLNYHCGRGLSLDFIEKCYPDWSTRKELSITDHSLGIIVFESSMGDRLSHITVLDLSRNQLQEAKHLAVLPSLETLKLASNAIRLMFAESEDFIPFPSLKTLDLRQNGLTAMLLQRMGLKYLTELKSLTLKENQLGTFNCQSFDLRNLEFLDISYNAIKTIKRYPLPSLKVLDLGSNRLKDIDGLSVPNIEILLLNGNRISTCASLTGLNNMPHLKNLDCRGNSVISRRVFPEYIKTQVPHLVSLNDANCEEVSGLPEVKTPILPRPHEEEKSPLIRSQYSEKTHYTLISTSASSEREWGVEKNGVYLSPNWKSNLKMPVSSSRLIENRNNSSSIEFVITGTRMERHYKH